MLKEWPVSEPDLEYGYRNDPAVLAMRAAGHTERRPCACRGVVEADPADPVEGVVLHQETTRHQAWQRANGL